MNSCYPFQVAEKDHVTFTELVGELTLNCVSDLEKARYEAPLMLSSLQAECAFYVCQFYNNVREILQLVVCFLYNLFAELYFDGSR